MTSPQEAVYTGSNGGSGVRPTAVVQPYLQAWLDFLRIDQAIAAWKMGTPSGGIEFAAGSVGGEMFLSDDVIAKDLMRFAGLDGVLAHVGDLVELDLDSAAQGKCGVFEDGIYVGLSRRAEGLEKLDRAGCLPDRP